MKKKAGIITFHAAHNYGANMQAYALQETVKNLNVDCEIINFITESQKDQYRPLSKRKSFKSLLKNSYFLLDYKNRVKKYNKFEDFINNSLNISKKEYNSLESLCNESLPYTHYISGSDQIWNTPHNYCDLAYFLPFVKDGVKIAYAPSFGPTDINGLTDKDKVAKYIKDYDFLSIRETSGAKLIKDLVGIDNLPIVVDPALLLSIDSWDNICSKDKIVDKDYIFFYTLSTTKEMLKITKQISKHLNLPVVISNITNQYDVFSNTIKKVDSGPAEFLNLIKNAKFICTSSFHGTIFSILYKKPFYAINGNLNTRIATLLNKLNLEDRSISSDNIEEKLKNIYNLDYSNVDNIINKEKEKSLNFLKNALDV